MLLFFQVKKQTMQTVNVCAFSIANNDCKLKQKNTVVPSARSLQQYLSIVTTLYAPQLSLNNTFK
jgi:hypothetical protein